MDIVKLAIVYDTAQAAASVQELDRRVQGLQQVTTTNSKATRTLEAGLRQMATQATGLSGAMSKVTQSMLLFAGGSTAVLTAAAAVAGYTLVMREYTKETIAANKAAEEFIKTQNAKAASLRSTWQEFRRLIDQIDAAIEAERRGGTFGQGAAPVFQLLNLGRGGRIADLQEARDRASVAMALASHALRLEENRKRVIQEQNEALEEQNRLVMLRLQQYLEGIPEISSALPSIAGEVSASQARLMAGSATLRLRGGPPPMAPPVPTAEQAAYNRELERQAVLLERQTRVLENGMFIMANAIEDFVITGTFAFEEFLNNILRMLYRDFSSGLIEGFLGSLSSAGGSVGTPSRGAPIGTQSTNRLAAPLQTNVTFNVTAIDAQSTAQFFERNGGLIAQQVASEADRSRAIRRRWARG